MHPPSFITALPLPSPQKPSHKRPRIIPVSQTPLPSTYSALLTQATAAVKAALPHHKLVEVQFPPVSNMATAALNELLDANRQHALTLLRTLSPQYSSSLIAVFPDAGEARLAAKAYGQTPFSIAAIPNATPQYVQGEGVVVVVNPGFNVDEWINMENLKGDKCIVAFNADLDKVRGGYYPRLFYPKLHKVKDRFLSRFEPVYYVKNFAGGGGLFRCFPGDWIVFWGKEVLWKGEVRPSLVDVQDMLMKRRTEELKKR